MAVASEAAGDPPRSNFVLSKAGGDPRELSDSGRRRRGSGAPLSAMPETGSSPAISWTATSGSRDSVVDLIGRFTAEAVKNGGNLIVERAPRDLKEKVSVWGQPGAITG